MIQNISKLLKIETSGEAIINCNDIVDSVNIINNRIQDALESSFFNKVNNPAFDRYLKTATVFNRWAVKINNAMKNSRYIFNAISHNIKMHGENIIDRDYIDYDDIVNATINIILSKNDYGNIKLFRHSDAKIEKLFNKETYIEFLKEYLEENNKYVEDLLKNPCDKPYHQELYDYTKKVYESYFVEKDENVVNDINKAIDVYIEFLECFKNIAGVMINSDFILLSRKINKMIVLEAKDKSGKTTLGLGLADAYFAAFKIKNPSFRHNHIDIANEKTHISRFSTPRGLIQNMPPKEGKFAMTDDDYAKFKNDEGKYDSKLQLAIAMSCIGNDENVKKLLDKGFIICDRSLISTIVYSINAGVDSDTMDYLLDSYKKLSTSNVSGYMGVYVFYLESVFNPTLEKTEYEKELNFDKLGKLYEKVYEKHSNSEYGELFSAFEVVNKFQVGKRMRLINKPDLNIEESDFTEEEKEFLNQEKMETSMVEAFSINSDVMELFATIESIIDHHTCDNISYEEYFKSNLNHIKEISDNEEI